MKLHTRIIGLALLLALAAFPARADDASALPERALGKPDAPVKVDEFVSLSCPHCAEFYADVMPELEKRYVDTGKVRFVMHDFVRDGADLKAATLARCMPVDEFFPFVKLLFKNQMNWVTLPDPEKLLMSYAQLGGLSPDKAKACLADTKLQNALVADMTNMTQKYNVEATPTFVVNDGAATIKGAQSVEEFAKVLDRYSLPKN